MGKETTWSQTLEREGEPVLELSMVLPAPEETGPGGVRMARYLRRPGGGPGGLPPLPALAGLPRL